MIGDGYRQFWYSTPVKKEFKYLSLKIIVIKNLIISLDLAEDRVFGKTYIVRILYEQNEWVMSIGVNIV